MLGNHFYLFCKKYNTPKSYHMLSKILGDLNINLHKHTQLKHLPHTGK